MAKYSWGRCERLHLVKEQSIGQMEVLTCWRRYIKSYQIKVFTNHPDGDMNTMSKMVLLKDIPVKCKKKKSNNCQPHIEVRGSRGGQPFRTQCPGTINVCLNSLPVKSGQVGSCCIAVGLGSALTFICLTVKWIQSHDCMIQLSWTWLNSLLAAGTFSNYVFRYT